MPPRPEEEIRLADLWQRIASHIARNDTALHRRLLEPPLVPWHELPTAERMTLLAAALLGRSAEVPRVRRELLQLVLDLRPRDGALRASEAAAGGWESQPLTPTAAQCAQLAEWWPKVHEPDFIAALRAAAGPAAAIAEVRRRLRGATERTAARFLHALGYPIAVHDRAKQRFLERIGLLPEHGTGEAERAQFLRAMGALANATGTPLPHVDRIVGAFAGSAEIGEASPAAVCVTKPRCRECPVTDRCPAYSYAAKIGATLAEDADCHTLIATTRPEDRPREKLQRDGAGALTDAELLAILLRTGSGKDHALALATKLLNRFGTLDRISHASVAELSSLRGVGPVKAVTLHAALELARRLHRETPERADRISSPEDAWRILRHRYLGLRVEHFEAVLLNAKQEVLRVVTVTEGILNQTLVHPREAFVEAIRDSAYGVLFTHNHPSGDPAPSRDDQTLTKRLVDAGRVLGVKVVDHIIFGRSSYHSFRESGEISET